MKLLKQHEAHPHCRVIAMHLGPDTEPTRIQDRTRTGPPLESRASGKERTPLKLAALASILLPALTLLAQQAPPAVTAGTKLRVQFNSEVGTGVSRVNDGVEVHLLKSVEAQGREALPVGTVLTGRVLAVRKGEKHAKSYPMIRLGFNRVTLPDGRTFPVEASLADLGVSQPVDSEGAASTMPPSKGGDVAVPVTTGAAGAGIGAIGGGGKGAAIGAGIGGAVGVLADLAAHSLQYDDFTLKRGRKAWLRLDNDLSLVPPAPHDAKD